MADMESLEDMLAALEGPSGGAFTSDLDNISNIDDFLDQIEEEARMSTQANFKNNNRPNSMAPNNNQYGGQSRPVSMAPNNNQYGGQSRPVSMAPNNNQYGGNQAQNRPVSVAPNQYGGNQAQNRPVSMAPQQPAQKANQYGGNQAKASGGHGGADFASQGYDVLNNRGKWVNYSGKASDFRIKGTTSTRVGIGHIITLRALDDNGAPAKIDNPKEFIGVILTHLQTGDNLTCWYRDNGNCEYDLGFVAESAGSVRMEIKLAANPMFDLNIQVEDVGTSLWVAKPRLPAKPREVFIIDIETADGSRPEGVAPFEVQTVGSVENLKLINNGDGTYRFQCIPQTNGHVTVQLTLHGQPIKNSPVTVQVGERQQMKIRQESTHVETLSDTRPPGHEFQNDDYDDYGNQGGYGGGGNQGGYGGGGNQGYGGNQGGYGGGAKQGGYGGGKSHAGGYGGGAQQGGQHYGQSQYQPRQSDVSNDDLNRLLDELGGNQ